MKALKFKLYGKTAHFKKPDVNSYCYFSYNHISKIHLFGMLGAIIGLGGYSKQFETGSDYPEFHEKLKNLRVSILPRKKNNGIHSKKIQVFNNQCGYVDSYKKVNNLIVQEQWLEDVEWEILIDMESDVEKEILNKIEEYILNRKTEYIPYLGKNDHFANLSEMEIIDINENNSLRKVKSLFYYEDFELSDNIDDLFSKDIELGFTFKDYMPCELNKENMYVLKKIGHTNRTVKCKNESKIYEYNGSGICFI